MNWNRRSRFVERARSRASFGRHAPLLRCFRSLHAERIMTIALEEIMAEAKRLPARERARLVDELLRDLNGDPHADRTDVAAAWEAEIERRAAEADSGQVDWTSHERVMADARALFAAARAG
ncbi:MAG: addiction module protein [Burkholderiales bacterium]|nr:addiction module protein [Burkholderiales bacterium]